MQDEDYEIPSRRKVTFKELSQDALEYLALQKDFDKIYQLAEKAPPKCMREFKQLKYKDLIYQIGDSVVFRQIRNKEAIDSIGRIKRIVSVRSFKDDQELPLLIVNWYCNKDDLAPQFSDFQPCLSTFELFLTEHESNLLYNKIRSKLGALFIESLQYKVKVLSFEDYEEQLGNSEERLYFMRAAYNTMQEKLIPPPTEWVRQCYCRFPSNPDLTYIHCETCSKWIHLTCAKLTEDEAKMIEHYICTKCKGGNHYN